MTDSTPLESPEDDTHESEPSPFRIALGFFILPLLLVIGGVGVFLLFGVLAHDSTDPAEYLPAINGRGINEPWQAAFHLSQQLQFNDELQGDREFASKVVRALEQAEDGDPRVRRFLAVALGRIGHPVAVPVLVDQLDDADGEVRLNSLWALGSLDAKEAADAVAARLDDDNGGVRTMAAYVLGVLRAPETGDELAVALNDPLPAVRWNAAVALGLMGDPAAYEQLTRMIDREHLATVPGVTPRERTDTMVAALTALESLGASGLESRLARIVESDPDLRVREAARKALAATRETSAHEPAPLPGGNGI